MVCMQHVHCRPDQSSLIPGEVESHPGVCFIGPRPRPSSFLIILCGYIHVVLEEMGPGPAMPIYCLDWTRYALSVSDYVDFFK